jgi:DNA-binding MarR family transcriptional regulator
MDLLASDMGDVDPIRVPENFEAEFPGASRSASEVAANLARAATALVAAIERPPRQAADLSASAFQTLAILDGAAEPLTSQTISAQLLVSSASMTSLLDTLERRGLVERGPHPTDRRKVLVHLTAAGRKTVDRQLPVIHAVIADALHDVSEANRERLITLSTTLLARLTNAADRPLPSARPRRRVRSSGG